MWRRVKMVCSSEEVRRAKIAKKLKRGGLLINDTLYWPPSEWNSGEHIVGFDFVSEEFIEYSCLDWQIEYKEVNFFRLNGCLALSGLNEAFNVRDFWVLKNVDDWNNSWQKLFSVDQTKVSPIIGISESGKCLVRESELKVVDFSQEALECTRLKNRRFFLPYGEKAVDHVDSLVSPFGTSESTEKTECIEAIKNLTTDDQILQDNSAIQSASQHCKVNDDGSVDNSAADGNEDYEYSEDEEEVEEDDEFSAEFDSDYDAPQNISYWEWESSDDDDVEDDDSVDDGEDADE